MASVLLAIHHPARTAALRDVLRPVGHRIHLAADLASALACVARHRVDLAIIDAGFTGAAVVAVALRRSQAEPRPRIVRLLDGTPATPWESRIDAAIDGDTADAALLALVDRLAPQPLPQPQPLPTLPA